MSQCHFSSRLISNDYLDFGLDAHMSVGTLRGQAIRPKARAAKAVAGAKEHLVETSNVSASSTHREGSGNGAMPVSEDLVELGSFTSPHGLRGELRFQAVSDAIEERLDQDSIRYKLPSVCSPLIPLACDKRELCQLYCMLHATLPMFGEPQCKAISTPTKITSLADLT